MNVGPCNGSKISNMERSTGLQFLFRLLVRTLLLTAGLAVLTFFTTFPFRYSAGHPDFQHLSKNIAKSKGSEKLNISGLNNGNWSTACLFGGYTNPSHHMAKFGKISIADQLYQPLKSWSVWRFGQVEEHETMIAYSEKSGSTTFIHLNSTIPSMMLEGHIQCTSRDKPFFLIPFDS